MPFLIRKFEQKQTLGEELKARRLSAHLTLSEVVAATHLKRAYIEAFERGTYNEFPDPVYTRHFLRAYVRALHADEHYFLERYDEEKTTCDLTLASRMPRKKTKFISFFQTTRLWKWFGAVTVVACLGLYLGNQILRIVSPPNLVILEPKEGEITRSAIVVVKGTSTDKANLQVNGIPVLPSIDGTFETEVPLASGVNTITIESSKRYSRTATLERHVILESGRNETAQVKETRYQ